MLFVGLAIFATLYAASQAPINIPVSLVFARRIDVMGWSKIDTATVPINRPVLVRTMEGDEPIVAFLSAEKIWYSGGALVQNSSTLLGATPTEWCEPDGDARL